MAEKIYQVREVTKNKIQKAIESKVKRAAKNKLLTETPCVELGYVTTEITARDGDKVGAGKILLIERDTNTDDLIPMYVPVERDVYNMSERVIKEDEYVYVLEDYHTGDYYAVPLDNDKRMRCDLADGNQFEEETAGDPHTSTSEQGINFEYTGASGEEIYNPLKIKLWQGCTVHCEWNSQLERWEVYAAESDKVVHGIQRSTANCRFEKLDGAVGWGEWDANSDLPWVTNVRYVDCSLYYDTLCDADNLIGNIDAVTNIEFNEDTCELYFYKCGNEIAGTAGQFDFVTSVYASGGGLYYSKKCGGENLIIELTSCPETPACGTCAWTADDQLSWVQTDSCTGTCECVPPAFPASVVGQTWSTNCEEP